MDDFEKEKRSLLDRFSKALKPDGRADAWFDEDELCDIFDYAGDLNMDYLRAEALFWGARYFPDSDILRERRGVFYSDLLSSSDVRTYSDDYMSERHTLLAELISLKAKGLSPEFARVELEHIMDKYSKFNDEEVIQFVNFAEDTDNLSWILKNFDRLRKKVEYLPSLLFEVSAACLDAARYVEAEPLLDELIAESPYNVDNWTMYAGALVALHEYDAANEAVDMALAIEPDNITANQQRSLILTDERNVPELEKLYARFPDDSYIAEHYMSAVLSNCDGRTPGSKEVNLLLHLCEKFPFNEYFIKCLLHYLPHEVPDYLSDLWEMQSAVPLIQRVYEWTTWALNTADLGSIAGAMEIVQCIRRNTEDMTNDKVMETYALEAMLALHLRRFNEAYSAAMRYIEYFHQTSPALEACRIVSALMMNNIKLARQLANTFLKGELPYPFSTGDSWRLTQRLATGGLYIFLNKFLEVTSDDMVLSDSDLEDLNPFQLW